MTEALFLQDTYKKTVKQK